MSSSSISRSTPIEPSTPDIPDRSTFVSKSLPRFALPSPGSHDFTAALCVAALVLLMGLQIVLPSRTDLPADTGLAPRHARGPAPTRLPDYPALSQRDLFSPNGAGDGGEANVAPLGERQVVGVFAAGRSIGVLIKAPGASAQLFHVGQAVEGWRLARIDRDAVTFDRGREQRRLIVGAPPQSASSQASSAAPAPQAAETSQ